MTIGAPLDKRETRFAGIMLKQGVKSAIPIQSQHIAL
jgi:hypothetical protein